MTDANEPLAQPGLDLALLTELRRLEDHLRELGAVVADCLRPGLSRGEIQAFVGDAFDHIPKEIVTWFAWHNGADEDDGIHGVDPWLPNLMSLLSLSEALAERESELKNWGPSGAMDPEPERTWQPAWLPLLGGGQLSLVADLGVNQEGPTPIHRINYWPDVPWYDVQEPSLKAMIRVWNGHFANGDHHWDADQGGWTNSVYDPDHYGVM